MFSMNAKEKKKEEVQINKSSPDNCNLYMFITS